MLSVHTDDLLLLPIINKPGPHSVLRVFWYIHIFNIIQCLVHSLCIGSLNHVRCIEDISDLNEIQLFINIIYM